MQMLKPQSCVSLHRNDCPCISAQTLQVFDTVKGWSGGRSVSPGAFLCASISITWSHLGVTAQSWALALSSLSRALCWQSPYFSDTCIVPAYLSMSSNWLITRFFSSWSRPLTPFKCFKINAFLGVVPTPAYLSSLSPQLHNGLCQPKEYFSSVSKSKDKVSFCFLRVWPVIGVLCMKFILLLSSVWVLNWVVFYSCLIHTREA